MTARANANAHGDADGGDDAAVLRNARPDDVAAIAVVHVRSWQATYAGHFPDDFLDALDPAQRAEGWRRYFEQGLRADETVLVYETGRPTGDARAGGEGDQREGVAGSGDIVGFAHVGPSRDEDARGAGELYAIYLLPERWGQGLGRALMARSLVELAASGFAAATLWVLEGNRRARRFYEAGGWRADGSSKVDDHLGFPIREVRYRRELP